jgi:hypothetical protein
MNEDFEDQLDKLFSDFKIKVTKLVSKNANKALKDQAKVLKEEFKYGSSPKRVSQRESSQRESSQREKSQKNSSYASKSRRKDDDSDNSDGSESD